MNTKRLLWALLGLGLLLMACTTGESPSGSPKTVADYFGYMPDFSNSIPSSFAVQKAVKSVSKSLYTGSSEPVVKTRANVAGAFSGSGLLYGGFEEMILFFINAIKIKMAGIDPAENAVVDLGYALYFNYPIQLGKAKWREVSDNGAMVFCYNENVGGDGTVKNDFAFALSPNGFKLFVIQENSVNPDKPRYITCDYDATTRKYVVYTFDASMTHQIATDYQAFVGEPLLDGSFRFFSRQWNEGETIPELYGLGYADANRGGYAVFYDKNRDKIIDPDSNPDEQARFEAYNASGDSVYIAFGGASGSATTAMGYDIKKNELFRLKYMTPFSGWSIDYNAQGSSAIATKDSESVTLSIGSLPLGTDLVTIGNSDMYGVFVQDLAENVPYITQYFNECLRDEHQDDRNIIDEKLLDIHGNWVSTYDLTTMHSIISEVPPLSEFADLK